MIDRSPICLMFLILATTAMTAEADRTPPNRNASTKLEIRADRRSKTNRLIIPRKLLKSAKRVASLDADPQDGNRLRTIFAGIALSMASISLVFVFLRKKSAATKTAAGLLFAAGVMFAASEMATADIAPPRSDVVRSWKRVGQQDVEIEISDKGDKVVLILGTYKRYRGRPNRSPRPKPAPPTSRAPQKPK